MEDHWKIMEPKRPGLCISVIGGAKSFKLDNKMRETFNAGLIKVYCLILHLFLLLFLLPLPSINLAPSSHSSSSKKNKNCSSFGFLTFELNIHIRKPIPYLLFFFKNTSLFKKHWHILIYPSKAIYILSFHHCLSQRNQKYQQYQQYSKHFLHKLVI